MSKVIKFSVSVLTYLFATVVAAFLVMIVLGGGEGNLNLSFRECFGLTISIYVVKTIYDLCDGFYLGFKKELDKHY